MICKYRSKVVVPAESDSFVLFPVATRPLSLPGNHAARTEGLRVFHMSYVRKLFPSLTLRG